MSQTGSRGALAQSHGNQSIFQTIRKGACQTISFTGTSAQASNAFATNVSVIRLFATQDCFIEFGSNPTADNTGMFIPGGIICHTNVIPGEKIAAIRVSNSGTLYITEGAP